MVLRFELMLLGFDHEVSMLVGDQDHDDRVATNPVSLRIRCTLKDIGIQNIQL